MLDINKNHYLFEVSLQNALKSIVSVDYLRTKFEDICRVINLPKPNELKVDEHTQNVIRECEDKRLKLQNIQHYLDNIDLQLVSKQKQLEELDNIEKASLSRIESVRESAMNASISDDQTRERIRLNEEISAIDTQLNQPISAQVMMDLFAHQRTNLLFIDHELGENILTSLSNIQQHTIESKISEKILFIGFNKKKLLLLDQKINEINYSKIDILNIFIVIADCYDKIEFNIEEFDKKVAESHSNKPIKMFLIINRKNIHMINMPVNWKNLKPHRIFIDKKQEGIEKFRSEFAKLST
jgi:hypothetical protein